MRGGAVDGLALHYLADGRGPVVVLLHGLGGFAASWRRTVEALAAQATVYALDLPGFGRSGKPRVRYDLEFFAAALHGFLDALGIAGASLVGHSLGGAVAVRYALSRPARVDRLALLGALVPGIGYRPSWVYRLLARPGLGEALALVGCRPVYRAALARCFHRPRTEEVEFLVECDHGERTGWEARRAYLATLRGVREDLEQRGDAFRRALAMLDLPVLLIHGRQDPVVPAAHCGQVAGSLPRATVGWLEACGHFPQLEHPEIVNDWLSQFLAGRPARR